MPFSLHDRIDFQLAGYYETESLVCVDLLPGYSSPTERISTARAPLIGEHNRQNVLAAVLAARVAGVSKAQIESALATFHNANHRLQLVAKISDVEYVNDSKATNVEAAWYALDGIKHPVVWIAGGTDKGNDYASLLSLARQKVKALVCLGVDNTKLRADFGGIIPHLEETQSMAEAVRRAAALAAPGDVVLLSPCCASFDLFKNYEDRGQQFIAAVQDL